MTSLILGILIGFFVATAVEFLWYGRRCKIHNIHDREMFEKDFKEFGAELDRFGTNLDQFGEDLDNLWSAEKGMLMANLKLGEITIIDNVENGCVITAPGSPIMLSLESEIKLMNWLAEKHGMTFNPVSHTTEANRKGWRNVDSDTSLDKE